MIVQNDTISQKTVHIPLSTEEEKVFEEMLRENAQKKSAYIKILILNDLKKRGYLQETK